MYKQTKLLISLFLVFAMLFSLVQPVAAAPPGISPGSIKLSGTPQVKTPAAAAQDRGPLIKSSFSDVFNAKTLPYAGDQSGPKGELKNVKTVLKKNIQIASPNTLAAIKSNKSGTIGKTSLTKAAKASKLDEGEIIFDRTAKKAIKITGTDGKNNFIYETPKIYELYDDLKIPRQEVDLTTANISRTVVPYKIVPATPYLKSVLQKTHMKPLVQKQNSGQKGSLDIGVAEMSFDNVTFPIPIPGGQNINVTLTGTVKVAAMRLTADYSFFDGYDFGIGSGEEIRLKATATCNLAQDFCIPIMALDTGGADGMSVGAGVYLMGNINGNFSLFVTFNEGLSIGAGIRGSTFAGIPTSFHPYINKDCYVNCDADFFGQVNASLGFGPKLYIEIAGITLVDAELRLAGVVDSTVTGGYMNIDIDGWIRLYLNVLGCDTDIVNYRWSFLSKQKKYTAGLDIKIDTACGYRDYVSGTIKEDKGTAAQQQGVFEDYTGDIMVTVKRGSEILEWPTRCEKGKFGVDLQNDAIPNGYRRINLIKDDLVSIRVLDRNVESEAVTPTNPFKYVTVDYADFFNDTLHGTVNAAQIGTQPDGRPIFAEYNKDIYITYFRPNTQGTSELHCTANNGEFKYDFDFKPYHNVYAELRFDGWTVRSSEIGAWHRLYFAMLSPEYTNQSRGSYYDKYESCTIVGTNDWGTKQITADVKMYYYITQPKTDLDIMKALMKWSVGALPKQQESIVERELVLTPRTDAELPFPISVCSDLYICRWSKQQAGTASPNIGKIGANKLILKTPINAKDFTTTQQNGTFQFNDQISDEWKNRQADYRDTNVTPVLDYSTDGLHSIFVAIGGIYYEDTLIASVSNISGKNNFRPETHQSNIRDPQYLEQMLDMVRNNVWLTHPDDPNELLDMEQLKEKYERNPLNEQEISNMGTLPGWASGPAKDMANWGIIDLEKGNTFPGDRNVTRGELTAYLSRMFGLKSSGKTPNFSDIGANYKYRNEIAAAAENGMIDGTQGGLFQPDQVLTMEEASTIIYKAMTAMLGADAVKNTATGKRTFKDAASISAVSKEAVDKMAAMGLYEGFAGTTFNPKSTITLQQVAAILDNTVKKVILR